MNQLFRMLASVLLAALPISVVAAPDANSDREIRHLVDFVSASGCTFIRNGDAHDSKSAAEHLLMKYGRAQGRLETTEQFIEAVATRSYLTGREYRVQCPGQPEVANAAWLEQELTAWRLANAGE
jgi:hypothetical protein